MSAVNLKNILFRRVEPRYGHVILVSVYPVMTAVNIDHNMNVQNLVASSHMHTCWKVRNIVVSPWCERTRGRAGGRAGGQAYGHATTNISWTDR